VIQKRNLTILCLSDRYYTTGRYSPSHPVLEDIFARIFPEKGHRVYWLMQSLDETQKMHTIPWHGSTICLLPSRHQATRYGRYYNFLWRLLFLRKAIEQAIEAYGVDLVNIRNDWTAALAMKNVIKKYHVPYVFNWSFPHYKVHEARIQDGLAKNVWMSRFRAFVEQKFYKRAVDSASHVLTVSEWFKEELASEGIPNKKMTPFPLSFDCSITPDSVDASLVRERHQLGYAPVVIYFGDMSRLRRMEFLLEVMARVASHVPDVRLLMVGAGDTPADLGYLKSVSDKLCISDQVIFTGFVPRSEIPSYIAAANVGVSPIRPIPLFQISSPTKLVETMGMACPIVANDIPEQQKLISSSGGGLCVPYEVEAFSEAVVHLLQNPEQARKMGLKGRRFIEQNRSTQHLAEELEALYFDLLDSATAE